VQLDTNALAGFPHQRSVEPGNFAMFEVEDTGAGIEPAHLSRIFEPFFTTKVTGRGLGLASVLGIVLAHGAALRVRSEAGRGTCFEIAWPLAEAQPVAVPAPPPRISSWKGSGQVLLVDDDPVVRRSLVRQLELIGFVVTSAASGAKALEIFRAAPSSFRLAVVDRTMPNMSGDRLIELLHECEHELPVVLVSGYSASGPVVSDSRIAFVAKPMTLRDLRQAIEALLEAQPLAAASVTASNAAASSTTSSEPSGPSKAAVHSTRPSGFRRNGSGGNRAGS
jgi:CheY-like chemotaxis protein